MKDKIRELIERGGYDKRSSNQVAMLERFAGEVIELVGKQAQPVQHSGDPVIMNCPHCFFVFNGREQLSMPETFGDQVQAQPVAFKYTAGAQAMRDEWKFHGGTIHGPNVETVCMPESKYFEFRRKLTRSMPEQNAAQTAQPVEPVAKAIVPGYIIEWLGPHFGTQLPKGEHLLCCHPPADVVRQMKETLWQVQASDAFDYMPLELQKAVVEAYGAAKEHGL